MRKLRRAKGLSQEELADRADINRNYVGMLEREQARQERKIRALAQSRPATYVVFDLLYTGFEPLPPGFQVWAQTVFLDASAAQGIAASDAVKVTVP